MNILEKEIEDIIYESISDNPRELEERGFYSLAPIDYTLFYRQIDLGVYGRADLISVNINKYSPKYRELFVTIYEIKKDEINNGTFLQSLRYFKGIQQLIKKNGYNLKNTHVFYQFCLIGKKVNLNCDFVYLPDVFRNVIIQTYHIDLFQGLTFKSHNNYAIPGGMAGCIKKMDKTSLKNYLRLLNA